MLILPDTKAYQFVTRPGAPTQETLPVYMALKRGLKRFADFTFDLTISAEKERDHTVFHMSSIGQCGRKLWFQMNHHDEYEELEGDKVSPALHLGHMVEKYVVNLLGLGELHVAQTQQAVKDLHGIITGHIDGLIEIGGERNLLEIKGLKHSYVELLIQNGVYNAIPVYYDQMQYYMFALSLKAGFFIAFDKDTSEFYIEKVAFDQKRVAFLRRKALVLKQTVLFQDVPEQYIVRDCRWCPLKEKCVNFEGRDTFVDNFVYYQQGRP